VIQNILFDFDGVILDSMPMREYGFKKIFEKYSSELVEKLLEYHNKNGGLSRYVKIRYFYEKLLNENISDNEVNTIADDFSEIIRKKLIDKKYLISETINFIKNNYKNYNLHIVSGSDEKELRFLCKELNIDNYFISINGSPTHKNDLVKNVLSKYGYIKNQTILIGDSINDYIASKANEINFYGYNNIELKTISYFYVQNYNYIKDTLK